MIVTGSVFLNGWSSGMESILMVWEKKYHPVQSK